MDTTLRQLERRAIASASPEDIAAYNIALMRAGGVVCIGTRRRGEQRTTLHAYQHHDPEGQNSKWGPRLGVCRGINCYNLQSIHHSIPTCKLCLRALSKGRKLAETELVWPK